IDAKSEDMRAFVEEAAGVSRYKERRKETEARVAETRENLERLQDVRDEVEKQIRHLQRQAASARRYQALKEQERRLTAELLALRLRDLDSGAQVHDAAVRERELAMQGALAEQRAAEAAIEKQRAVHAGHSERLSAVQGRYYEVGAEISRLEQSIEHARELRERQRADLAQAQTTLGDLGAHMERDEREVEELRTEIARLTPAFEAAQHAEQRTGTALEASEHALQDWQQRWETHARAVSEADQTAQVERARIEQLENQLRQLRAQAERLAAERQTLSAQDGGEQLARLALQEEQARGATEQLTATLTAAQVHLQAQRAAQLAAEQHLEQARAAREEARTGLTSLEALQAAALADHAGQAGEWLRGAGLAGRPRLAAALEVESGWERAVETVLGDHLEAVCVERLEDVLGALGELTAGRVTLVESGGAAPAGLEATLAAHVTGPAAVSARLAAVSTAESLGDALRVRAGLAAGRSLAEERREQAQAALQDAQQKHAGLRALLEAGRARAGESSLRDERLRQDAGAVGHERAATEEALARAAAELARAQALAAELEERQRALDSEREQRRAALSAARAEAQAAQAAARDLQVRVESRRSAESSMAVGLSRMSEQREQLTRRRAELEQELASGDEPIVKTQARLHDTLSLRLTVEAELAVARGALEEADAALRTLDEQRLAAERRVSAAREAMDAARLAAQETHVRRAALAEQFAQTRCELPEVLANLEAAAAVPAWEQSLEEARADIERLGQVNLAAIDELKEQTQRQEYLDSQFADLTSALATLDEAMRRIDKETRTRFQDTFERINAGLRDKFPRLFGGGHAYLELVGEDKLTAGVAVMARPPGKKNSTIHLLSGGEKALTAVALVFAIFDLNPAPFCLLDEVDAPLDEHNVGRFCDIVRDMSNRVQFVFITHNKSTMELASQLIGVTMNEPGVSRLVTVDVDEAVRLAAV
ncbi:MAG: chromosome segregation protein SMC, partial [Gammaproteobacteria bacterium]